MIDKIEQIIKLENERDKLINLIENKIKREIGSYKVNLFYLIPNIHINIFKEKYYEYPYLKLVLNNSQLKISDSGIYKNESKKIKNKINKLLK